VIESWVEIVADSTPLLQWKSGCIFRSAVSDIVAEFGLLKGLSDRNYALVEFRRSFDVRSLLLLVSNLSRYLQDLAVQITPDNQKNYKTTTFVGEETYLGHLECRGPRKISITAEVCDGETELSKKPWDEDPLPGSHFQNGF